MVKSPEVNPEDKQVHLIYKKLKEITENESKFKIEHLIDSILELSTVKTSHKLMQNSYTILLIFFLIKVNCTHQSPILLTLFNSSSSILIQIAKLQVKNKRLDPGSPLFSQIQRLLIEIDPIFALEVNSGMPNRKIIQSAYILKIMASISFNTSLKLIRSILNEISLHTFFSFLTSTSKPYLPFQFQNSLTLVLDMDETLGFFSGNKILVRPGLSNFLSELSAHYELVLFTSSLEKYAKAVMKEIDPNCLIKFRLFRQHLEYHEKLPVKDLNCIGRDLNKTIIVDNNPLYFRLQKENGIKIKSWKGDPNDTELIYLGEILKSLAKSKPESVQQELKKIFNKN